MPDGQIFKATYSGIPVYEMMCKGVAVMRRRSDGWLNATQILKVAGFDKPQRTRVLEREVQKGEHEKVQGGYGKYQGTWIPLERGIAIAKQHNCEALLRPIIEFQPAAKSPPPAPKHVVQNPTSRPARKGAPADVSGATPVHTRYTRRQVTDQSGHDLDHEETLSAHASEDGTMTPSPSEASSSSRTPSPIRSPGPSNDVEDSYGYNKSNTYHRSQDSRFGGLSDLEEEAQHRASYADLILEFFISDSNQIPDLIVHPPPDFDPNMAIDDDGHTPLHWACAMGRIRIVKLLLSAGADVFKVNKSGQTALMRSVMFANNYDIRKFPELYELLHRSTLNIDHSNRTVFHHIVDVAMSKGKTHAARYYMETVLGRLSDFPKELADIINFQDEDGESALTLAARCRSKRLVKLLIDHGANPKIQNNDGKSAEDYILEDERFRASPVPPSRTASMSFRNLQAAYPPSTTGPGYPIIPPSSDRPSLHYSAAAQKAATKCLNEIAALMESLAASFDTELRDKERDMTQAQALLSNIQAEILESQRSVSGLRAQAEGLTQGKQALENLETSLQEKMGRRYRLGWEKWLKEEEERERSIRDAANGELLIIPSASSLLVDDAMEIDASVDTQNPGKRKAAAREDEDISDLIALHSDIPTTPEGLRQACEALREDIAQHCKRRKVMFDELVSFQAEAGTSGRMGEYRRLIGAGCGGVPAAEVDQVLGMLLETLESEEPSSSAPWGGTKPVAVG